MEEYHKLFIISIYYLLIPKRAEERADFCFCFVAEMSSKLASEFFSAFRRENAIKI